MSIAWGAAIDAEVSYRQERVRADYHHQPRKHFFFHHKIEPAAGSARVTALPLQKTERVVAASQRKAA